MNNYIAHHCYIPIYCKRSLDKKKEILKKKWKSKTLIHQRLLPSPLLSPYLMARETEKKWTRHAKTSNCPRKTG